MKKILLVIPLLLITLLLSSCDTAQIPARGFEDEIFVFADSVEYSQLEEILSQVFEKEIQTPQPERLFTLRRVEMEEINRLKTFKNILVVAPLTGNSKATKYINTLLDPAAKQKIESGEGSFIIKRDLWAKGQLVTIITAKDMATLEYELLRNSDKLLYNFQKASDQRLKEGLLGSRFEDKESAARLLSNFSWTIFVQKDYKIAIMDKENNFAWIRRTPNTELEIWISVHWIENGSPELLNRDSVYVLRNRLTEKYYRTSDEKEYVVIEDSAYTMTETNFNGRYAILTQGLWRMTDKFMGGPFVSYAFYDESSKRVYILDGSVYAPKYFKRNLIQQADVILQSFRTKSEIPESEVTSILSNLK